MQYSASEKAPLYKICIFLALSSLIPVKSIINLSNMLLEQIDDKLYIYLEYVSGGSIHKLLQEYGPLGEQAIRSFTQQTLSGLAYLHAKATVHRYCMASN